MENRYERIARELASAITSGQFPVGSQLPTEAALCEQFDASRNTVRAALRELQDLGLITRRKKAGTRVASAQPSSGYRHSFDSVDELVQFGARHVREVRDVADVVADRALAMRIGGAAGKQWLRISSLRLEEGSPDKPVGWTDVYVDAGFEGLADLVRAHPETLVSTLIEAHYGRRIAAIRQQIRGIVVPAALAPVLRIKAGSAGLEVTRHYEDSAGEIVEASVSVHPADRFTVVTRLTRERPADPSTSPARCTGKGAARARRRGGRGRTESQRPVAYPPCGNEQRKHDAQADGAIVVRAEAARRTRHRGPRLSQLARTASTTHDKAVYKSSVLA
jgi:GntR family transcriptional regulator